LLYFLKSEQRAEQIGLDSKQAMDWGTLVVFTCVDSCQGKQAEQLDKYVEEFVYRQPPADLE
jgi:hypothetical protein